MSRISDAIGTQEEYENFVISQVAEDSKIVSELERVSNQILDVLPIVANFKLYARVSTYNLPMTWATITNPFQDLVHIREGVPITFAAVFDGQSGKVRSEISSYHVEISAFNKHQSHDEQIIRLGVYPPSSHIESSDPDVVGAARAGNYDLLGSRMREFIEVRIESETFDVKDFDLPAGFLQEMVRSTELFTIDDAPKAIERYLEMNRADVEIMRENITKWEERCPLKTALEESIKVWKEKDHRQHVKFTRQLGESGTWKSSQNSVFWTDSEDLYSIASWSYNINAFTENMSCLLTMASIATPDFKHHVLDDASIVHITEHYGGEFKSEIDLTYLDETLIREFVKNIID